MLNLLIITTIIHISLQATDFENARIVGLPRLTCSKKSITFHFETNVPFQGRISIMKKMYIPECNQDYAVNINRSGSFEMDIGRCTDTTYMTNGSRVLSAHVEIGFHPLVITSSDRVYSVQCIDNSYTIVRPKPKPEPYNCTHTVRMASRWEGVTSFHVGDSVVHEWNCNLEPNDLGFIQTFLTSCNAISQAGQVIHLIDENGCIVDSELMGDLVYNSFIPKIYARAKVFKLMSGEKYRIDCNLQMCRKGGACGNRPFPPKCAFTRDEILTRFESKKKDNSIEDALMTGSINMEYEKQVKVSSEWLTVHYNQYTNVDQLHERYYITSLMNQHALENTTKAKQKHFLMSISYRDPSRNVSSTEDVDLRNEISSDSVRAASSHSFKPEFHPQFTSSEERDIETITSVLATSALQTEFAQPIDIEEDPLVSAIGEHPLNSSNGTSTSTTNTTTLKSLGTTLTVTNATGKPVLNLLKAAVTTRRNTAATRTPLTKPSLRPPTTITFERVTPRTISSRPLSSANTAESVRADHSTEKPLESTRREARPAVNQTVMHVEKVTKPPIKTKVATMRFYTDPVASLRASHKPTPTTPYTEPATSTTAMPFEDNRIFSAEVTIPALPKAKSKEMKEDEDDHQEIKEGRKEKYQNARDWRLDDRTINDTDIFSDRQVACANTTVISADMKCGWSGLDPFLLLWSLGSMLVWVVLVFVCCYQHGKEKPTWVEYRDRELQRVAHARVLQQEHPWIHADAFEEPKIRNKHEIDMSKF